VSGLQGYQFEERISLKADRLGKDCLQHWVPLNPWRACFHCLSFIYTPLFYIRYVFVCFVFGMIKIFAGFFGKW